MQIAQMLQHVQTSKLEEQLAHLLAWELKQARGGNISPDLMGVKEELAKDMQEDMRRW